MCHWMDSAGTAYDLRTRLGLFLRWLVFLQLDHIGSNKRRRHQTVHLR